MECSFPINGIEHFARIPDPIVLNIASFLAVSGLFHISLNCEDAINFSKVNQRLRFLILRNHEQVKQLFVFNQLLKEIWGKYDSDAFQRVN